MAFYSGELNSQVRVKIKIWNAAIGEIVQEFMKNINLLQHMRPMFRFRKLLLLIPLVFPLPKTPGSLLPRLGSDCPLSVGKACY